MSKVILNAQSISRLMELDEVAEVCDEHGQLVGHFQPISVTPKNARSPYPQEEVEKLRGQKGGRPLADILRDLKAR